MNNISPLIWGPPGWKFLHYITFSYPTNPTNDDKTNYMNFFNSIGNILPCSSCRTNYKSHINKYPLTDDIMNNKDKLIRWLIDIHNEVNIMNGMKTLSYEEVYNIYFPKKWNQWSYYMIIILVIILIWIYKKYFQNNEYDNFVSKIIIID